LCRPVKPPKWFSNNTSVQLNSCLLTSSFNSKIDYNKASKKHKYNAKTVQIYKDKTLNKQNEKYKAEENNIKEVLGQNPTS